MGKAVKESTQALHRIAMTLGNPIGNLALPWIASTLVVGLSVKPFKEDISGLLLAVLYIGGSALMTVLALKFYIPFNGKRILGAIEKDYGPRTRQHVYNYFAEAQEGQKISLDIPGLARAYGEAK
jgi:hypothetical protein